MKTNLISLAFLLLCSSFLFADTFKVEELQGKIKYRTAGSFKKSTLKVGDQLKEKDRLSMKKGDFLRLKSSHGDVVTLKDKCYLKISTLSSDGKAKTEINLNLFVGKIKCQVHKLSSESSFRVKTPVAVAGVRGTVFGCVVKDSGETQVFVFEGEVTVQDVEMKTPVARVSGGKRARVKTNGSVRVMTLPARMTAESFAKPAVESASATNTGTELTPEGESTKGTTTIPSEDEFSEPDPETEDVSTEELLDVLSDEIADIILEEVEIQEELNNGGDVDIEFDIESILR